VRTLLQFSALALTDVRRMPASGLIRDFDAGSQLQAEA
jgi:hypothetical protein